MGVCVPTSPVPAFIPLKLPTGRPEPIACDIRVAQAQPAAQEDDSQDPGIDVPAHKRTKRGSEPLDPALPGHVVGMSCLSLQLLDAPKQPSMSIRYWSLCKGLSYV